MLSGESVFQLFWFHKANWRQAESIGEVLEYSSVHIMSLRVSVQFMAHGHKVHSFFVIDSFPEMQILHPASAIFFCEFFARRLGLFAARLAEKFLKVIKMVPKMGGFPTRK